MQQVREDRFSFANFYGRRIKRLFPAMFATVILSAIFAFLLFTPTDFESFGGSAIFTPVGLSNVFFWLEAGYWDSSKYVKPLLHTWSLAVEEQFYLIWPFLIVALYAWRKTLILPVLILMSLLSLIAAE